IDAPGFEPRSPGGVAGASGDTYWTGMRRASQERSKRDDPPHSAALGHIEERLRIGAPLLMRLRAAKQESAVAAIPRMPREELTFRPMDVTFPISPQPHLGPFLGQHEELFRVYPRQPRGGEVADQMAQGTRCRLAGIDPSSIRHHHRGQVSRRLAIKLDVVHGILAQKLGLVANGVNCNSCVQQDLSWVCK